jgi:coenzyme F420-reducing hydrogenase beta subunit
MPILADSNNCSGCLACVESCNLNAISAVWNDEGHLTYQVNYDKCVECHRCEKSCPVVNGCQYGSNDLTLSKPYAAWCTNEVLRAQSTSGGVFAAIASNVLNKGGIVYGASMQDSVIKHIAIDRTENLYKLQGSKYAQSSTKGTYRDVLKQLKKGRLVLFSGLACQVAGLLNFLPANMSIDNLITIDLICGGVPSRALITKYLEQEKENVKEIASFRTKSLYQFVIVKHNNTKEIVPLALKPLPLCGFYTELTNKMICYNCRYVGAHRMSDITIGDYWGDVEYMDQHKNGLSVAVAHTEKALTVLMDSDLEIHPISWDTFLMHNTRMVYGVNRLSKSHRRKRLADAIKHDSFRKFMIDYANAATPRQPLYFLRKLIVFAESRLLPDKRRIFVRNLLKIYKKK